MNTFSYIVLRIARSFGIKGDRDRLLAARRESTLLSEAENLLGQMAWNDAEEIDELSEEYWKIKELQAQDVKFAAEIKGLESENERLMIEHDRLEEKLEDEIAVLADQKAEKMQEALSLMHQAEERKSDAELTKKKFTGMKTKYKVFVDSGESQEQLSEIMNTLHELKEQYAKEKKEIAGITDEIHRLEEEANGIEDEIGEVRERARERLTAMMAEVGKSSNLVARHSAKIGAISRAKKDLMYQVGAFLSVNAESPSPEIRRALRKHRQMLSKIATLRRSIRYNKILSGREET